MTTLTVVPASPNRAVPWHRLGWVVWRRYRSTLFTTVAVLATLALYLVIAGGRMRSAFDAAKACAPADSPACQTLYSNLQDYGQNGLLSIFLILLPGLLGVFAGAPLLAREFENGTYRYTWTQGVGRTRWAIGLLVPGAVGVALATGAFGLLLAWYEQPLVDNTGLSRLDGQIFPITGAAAAGWAFAGFGIGVLAGMLWRRVVPALVSAFAVWFGLAFVAATVFRERYAAPLTTTSPELPGGALGMSQWWTKNGVVVGDTEINAALQSIGVQINQSANGVSVHAAPGAPAVDPFQYLVTHGFAQVTSYQPASRFWPFQWIEFGWLAALSLLLLAGTWWLLRRRAG